jgi:hypothetical protein
VTASTARLLHMPVAPPDLQVVATGAKAHQEICRGVDHLRARASSGLHQTLRPSILGCNFRSTLDMDHHLQTIGLAGINRDLRAIRLHFDGWEGGNHH